MHVSAILKGPVDQVGRRKVYICMITDGKRTFRATGIRVDPTQWKGGRVTGNSGLNEQIKSLILSYEKGFHKPDISFNRYALECLQIWESTKSPLTISDIQAKIRKFKKFFDGKLSGVTPEILNGYVSWCLKKKNKNNTVWNNLKAVRLIVNQAFKEGLINDNPFRIFSMPKYKDPQKVYLSKDQVKKIERLVFGKCTREYKIAGAWFLIACYTGLRFADQKAFSKSKIKSGRLVIYTSKTGQPVSIKLNNHLKKLFDLIDYSPIPFTNPYYNRVLKAIAAECDIAESISVHTARHTAATLLASAGVSIEVTAKILGHKSIRQTAVYYQITGDRIDKELEKIF